MQTQPSISLPADNNHPNIMVRLKNDTQAAHQHLEKAPCFKRLFAKDYRLNEYTQLLSYFYGYFSGIEPLLFDNLPAELHSQLLYRRKTHLLQQDLNVLGINSAGNLPICEALPNLTTFAQKMGALYVLEGSLLGGRVIGRHLSQQLGDDVSSALNFYHCYGADLETQWRGFAVLMTQCFDSQPEAEINAVLASATATFATLGQWVAVCAAKEESGDFL